MADWAPARDMDVLARAASTAEHLRHHPSEAEALEALREVEFLIDECREQMNALAGSEAGELRPRSGFTLMELLATIGIITVLIAILIPAVQAARESARKTECQNKLKQMALAAQMHHDTLGAYPAAVPYTGTRKTGKNFHVALLPYLEQPEPGNTKAAHPAVYLCPTTTQRERQGHAALGPNGVTYAPSVGTNGLNYDQPTDGFSSGRPTRISEISDGTSQTISIAEIIGRDGRGSGFNLGTHVGEHADINCGSKDKVAQAAFVPPNGALCEDDDDNPCTTVSTPDRIAQARHAIRSQHTGGAHVAFADGSARFLSESIALQILQALGTKAAGDIPSDF